MGKHIGTGGLARGKILGRLAFYTWVVSTNEKSDIPALSLLKSDSLASFKKT